MPSLASDVAATPNPNATGVVISHAIKTTGVANAINDSAVDNGTKSFWSRIGGWGMNALNTLNKPLQEVQKDYKFLHSVYSDHGNIEGLIATLGVLGGGAAGFLTGGFAGAAVGADLAAAGERNLAKLFPNFKGSVSKSEDPNYKVSMGRDFSQGLGSASAALGDKQLAAAFRNTDHGLGQIVSGAGDLAFDLKSDPIILMGNFAKLMRDGKLLKEGEIQARYPLANAIPAVRDFVISHSNVPTSFDQMDKIRQGNAGYQRAIEDIANTAKNADNSAQAAGNILVKYPSLAGAAGRLSTLKSTDEVHDFFKTALFMDDVDGTMGLTSALPSRGLLKASIGDTTVAQALAEKIQKMPAGKYTGNVALDAPLLEKIKNAPDLVMGSVKNLPGNLYKTFTGYMPYSIDAETGKLSNTQFRWNAPDAATVIYRIAKGGGLGESGAREMAGKYAEAVAEDNINLARDIKNRTIFEAFKAIGLPEESKYASKVYNEVNKVDTPTFSSQIYDVDENGEPLGAYITDSGQKMGGLFPRHTSEMWNIPNLIEAKAAMRQYGKLSKQYSNFDDFVGDWYTKRIFKPLALANVGFALRVTAAELIPAISRFGVANMFKTGLGKAAAKSNSTLLAGEGEHVYSAVLTALGAHMGISPDVIASGFPAFQRAKSLGLNYAAKMLAPEQMEIATRVILQNEAHILKEAVSAGHNSDSISHDLTKSASYFQQVKQKSAIFNDSPDYTVYSKEDPHYLPLLQSNINKAAKSTPEKIIADDIAKNYNKFPEFSDLKDSLVENEYQRLLAAKRGEFKPYNQDVKTVSRAQYGDLRSLASDRVGSVFGKVIGSDGTYHPDIVDSIASGKVVEMDTLRKKYDANPASLPKGTGGPVMLEPPMSNMFSRIVDNGFKKVLDPIINNLSRENIYLIHVADEVGALGYHVKAGLLTDDQALSLAQQRAVVKMMPQIHNVSLRSNFAQAARNFLPFYFAQEQALKRAFSAMKDTSVLSPVFSSTLRYYQLAEHALSNPAFVETDDQGNRYMYLPFGGALGEGVQSVLSHLNMPMYTGLPMSVRGNMTSLKSVLPELNTPGVSPFLAVSGNLISDLFPEAKGAVKGTIGDIAYGRGFLDTVFPSAWMKNAFHAMTDNEKDTALAGAISSAMAAAYYHNQIPGANATGVEKQDFLDKLKNNAKSVLITKALLGLFSPLAPRVEQEDPGLRDEFWKLVKSKGNIPDALVTFMGEHGDRAISYTVAKTENKGASGASYPITQQTIDFYNQHKGDLFKTYPVGQEGNSTSAGAFFLIPQDGKNASDINAFSEMVRMGLRSQRTPDELLKQMYISAGWQQIDAAMKQHVAAIQQYKANYDTYSQKLENDAWSQTMAKMENINPVWYKSYSGGEGRVDAKIAYNQLLKIYQNGAQPNNKQADLIGGLIQDYMAHQSTLNQYKQYSISGYSVKEENQNWQNHLLAVQVNQPQLDAVIKSVFSKLD